MRILLPELVNRHKPGGEIYVSVHRLLLPLFILFFSSVKCESAKSSLVQRGTAKVVGVLNLNSMIFPLVFTLEEENNLEGRKWY